MRRTLLAVAVSALGLAGCASLAPERERTPAEWQAMARADLEATYKLVQSAHPGSIDHANPAFAAWAATGYQEALTLIPRVVSYDTALQAIRYYVTGFEDGHFIYSDNQRGNAMVLANGWRLDESNGMFVVTRHSPDWPDPLPPIGAQLIDCGGRPPAELIRTNVAPFVDRRPDPAVIAGLSSYLMLQTLAERPLERCTFKVADARQTFDISYRDITSASLFEMSKGRTRAPRRVNDFTVNQGVLWIRAANFMLSPSQAAELDTMLLQLARLEGIDQIIFDTRGNTGGNSGVGDRIFDAATGGLDYKRAGIEKLPMTYAEWRVSSVAIAEAQDRVKRTIDLYGPDSPYVSHGRAFAAELQEAQREGMPWVRQEAGFLLTRDEVKRRAGKLKRFTGKVALITDEGCASACLDFADLVRLVPGSVHLGKTTSSDTVYIDVGSAELSSGNSLRMPLKVWRNRARGNNEPLVPDILLNVDMHDDTAVRNATLAALGLK